MSAPARQTSTHSTQFADLSPAQATVVAALAEGRTITAAAETAGIHRATIYNWLNTCPAFGAAIDEGREAFQDRVRGEMSELTALALQTLRELMEDPKASPSVRLKAALAILKRSGQILPAAPPASAEQNEPQLSSPTPPARPDTTPRNAACPCGSGLKYKRCCGVEAPPHLSQHAHAA